MVFGLVVILILLVFYFLLVIFFRHDLLDISPTLSEAAGAIVDVSFLPHFLFIVLLYLWFWYVINYLSENQL